MGTTLSDADSDLLRKFSASKYERFQSDLSTGAAAKGGWDVVIITAADEGHKHAYEARLDLALSAKALPVGLKWIVVADPPGPKIGSGGATLFVLSKFATHYGDRFAEMRVLLIHAGGYSQRLPSMSVCGKIFAALPVALESNGLPCTMLQLKLSMCCDISKPERMLPGAWCLLPGACVCHLCGRYNPLRFERLQFHDARVHSLSTQKRTCHSRGPRGFSASRRQRQRLRGSRVFA
jgi:hypothetical protein